MGLKKMNNSESTSITELGIENRIFKRRPCRYRDLSQHFHLKSRNYEKQFYSIYAQRISEVRELLQKAAIKKFGKPVQSLMRVKCDDIEEGKCAVLGTIYKRQELKPSILKEVSKQYQTVPPPPRTHFVSDTDELILEDETQRVTLSGHFDAKYLVTGIVVAVFGTLQSNGVFVVEDYCFAEPTPVDKPFPSVSEDTYLILISGLELATNASVFEVQLFIDWVTGWLGTIESLELQSKIALVVIAGNCIRSVPQEKAKYGKIVDNGPDVAAVKELDDLLEQLAENVNVDVMPGEYDPTNHTLPQQPLHQCLFPKARRFTTFRSVTNPHMFEIENRLVIGTAGQPVQDIQRYSDLTDPLDALEKTLEWGHIAPTAPDTLPCYPYDDNDPFILKRRPDIYFAGNQLQFQTKVKKHKDHTVRLICVPSFAKTKSCIAVNLQNLECHTVLFDICE